MEKQSTTKKPRSQAQIDALTKGRATRTANALAKKEAQTKPVPPPPPPSPEPVKKTRAPRVAKPVIQKMVSEGEEPTEKVDTYEKPVPVQPMTPPVRAQPVMRPATPAPIQSPPPVQMPVAMRPVSRIRRMM